MEAIKTLKVAVLATITFLASQAYAQDYSPDKTMSVGLEAGQVNVSTIANNIAVYNGLSMVNAFGGTASERVPTSVGEGRLYFGNNFTENWGIEVGYFYTTALTINYSGVTGRGIAWTAQTSNSISSLDVMATLKGSSGSGFENFFIKAGLQDANLSQTRTVSAGGASVSVAYNHSGVGTAFGFGYDKGFSSTFDGRITYTYMNNIGGQSGLSAVLINAGVVYKF